MASQTRPSPVRPGAGTVRPDTGTVRPDTGTRHALLDLLKREGPAPARALAGRLGVTAAAIGLHLAALEAEGMVESRPDAAAPARRGRPTALWALTEKARGVFPDAHAQLTVGLLGSLREVYGEEGLGRLLTARTRRQADEYRQALPAGAPLAARLKALARLRDAEGYMAEVKPDGDGGFLLVENHCPICSAARACPGFCASELDVFRSALGPGIVVERREHVLAGARRCAYSVRPRAEGKAAGGGGKHG